MNQVRRVACWLAIAVLALLGSLWAFQRGGQDFNVFYEAWRLVLSGHGDQIYIQSPDRFLYAPGFAWLFAPIALLPRDLALGLWCVLKACALGFVSAHLASALKPTTGEKAWALCALGMFLVARPVLIDFQYGQVNLFILASCAWALMRHLEPEEGPGWQDSIAWAVLAIAAFAKLYPLPLLLVPLLQRNSKLGREALGIAIGLALVAAAPLLTTSLSGVWALYSGEHGWVSALVSKGLPTDSHNQSFSAFLHHYFSGQSTHVISEGMIPIQLGYSWLSSESIELLSVGWTLVWLGILLGWLGSRRAQREPLEWMAVAIALLIVPSHLIWKPYFALGLPVAVLAARQAHSGRFFLLLLIFTGLNLTGFDLVGHELASRLEAGSVLLAIHLLLTGWVAWPSLFRGRASSSRPAL